MTKIISAFPGSGKTYFKEHSSLKVLDSDSSKYSWIKEDVRNPEFPANYLIHIKEVMKKSDIILVSSHREVREALTKEGIEYTLVYPKKELKEEYIERFRARGSSEKFVDLIAGKWEEWISECEKQTGCNHQRLSSGQYLSDILQSL